LGSAAQAVGSDAIAAGMALSNCLQGQRSSQAFVAVALSDSADAILAEPK